MELQETELQETELQETELQETELQETELQETLKACIFYLLAALHILLNNKPG